MFAGFRILIFRGQGEAIDGIEVAAFYLFMDVGQLFQSLMHLMGFFLNLMLQPVPVFFEIQMGTDPVAEDGQSNGFGNVVDSPKVKSFGLIGGLVHCGDKYDGDIFGVAVCFEVPADLIAIHFRHHDIQQDEIRPLVSLCKRKGLASAFGNDNLVVFAQGRCQNFDVHRFIIHHQDVRFFLGCVHFIIPARPRRGCQVDP